MNYGEIIYNLLKYWRFDRQYICATEVATLFHNNYADILCYNGKGIIEIEIKTSIKDLKADKNKKKKHEDYKTEMFKNRMPNYFYYAVPDSDNIIECAKKQIEKLNNKYGLIIVNGFYKPDIIIRAKKLTKDYSKILERNIILRCSSELVSKYRTDQNAQT